MPMNAANATHIVNISGGKISSTIGEDVYRSSSTSTRPLRYHQQPRLTAIPLVILAHDRYPHSAAAKAKERTRSGKGLYSTSTPTKHHFATKPQQTTHRKRKDTTPSPSPSPARSPAAAAAGAASASTTKPELQAINQISETTAISASKATAAAAAAAAPAAAAVPRPGTKASAVSASARAADRAKLIKRVSFDKAAVVKIVSSATHPAIGVRNLAIKSDKIKSILKVRRIIVSKPKSSRAKRAASHKRKVSAEEGAAAAAEANSSQLLPERASTGDSPTAAEQETASDRVVGARSCGGDSCSGSGSGSDCPTNVNSSSSRRSVAELDAPPERRRSPQLSFDRSAPQIIRDQLTYKPQFRHYSPVAFPPSKYHPLNYNPQFNLYNDLLAPSESSSLSSVGGDTPVQ